MGNSSEKQRQQRVLKSKFRFRISEFLDRYGKMNSQQVKQWVDDVYSPNLYSVTMTKFAAPTYRRSKEELLQAFDRAYEGQWRARLIKIVDVTNTGTEEVIQWTFVNDVPHKTIPGKRVDLYFEVVSSFDIASGLWTKSSYTQFIPESQQKKSVPASIPSSYPTNSGGSNNNSNREEEERRQRATAQQREEEARRAAQQHHEAQERQHRENMRRQEEQWREYQRQQQLAAEQRAREAQQAAIKNNRW